MASSKVGIMAQAPVSQSPAKGTSVMVMSGGGVGSEAFVSGNCYMVRYLTFLLLVVFADLSREHVVFRNLSRDQG